LVYAFAVLDATTFNIKVFDPWVDTDPTNVNGQMYSKFVALKKQNPSLKTMIAIGGWTDSTDGTAKYSKLVSSTTNINTFVSSVVNFLKLYGFDGLDVDWEYPASAADKAGFVQLLSALRTAFGSTYLLSIAVGASSATANAGIAHDVRNIIST
jgi:chitinase